MATGLEHYNHAEQLLALVEQDANVERDELQMQRISAAQVHATLALVATRAGNYTQAGQDYIDSVNAGIKSAGELGLL